MAQRISSPYADNAKLKGVIEDSVKECKEAREGSTWIPDGEKVPVDLYEDEAFGRFADPIEIDDFEAPEVVDPDEEFEKFWEDLSEECLSVPCKLEDENGFFIAFDIDALKDSFHSYCKSFCMNWDSFNKDDFRKCAVDWQAGDCEVLDFSGVFASLFPDREPSYEQPLLVSPSRGFDFSQDNFEARWCWDPETANDFIWSKMFDWEEIPGRVYMNKVYSELSLFTMDDLFDGMSDSAFDFDVEKKLLKMNKGRYAQFPYGLVKGFVGIPIRIGGIEDLEQLYESEVGDLILHDCMRATAYDGASYSYDRFIDLIAFKLRCFCGRYRYRTEDEVNDWEDRHRFIRNFRR